MTSGVNLPFHRFSFRILYLQKNMTSGVNLPFHRFSFRILYFKFDWEAYVPEN